LLTEQDCESRQLLATAVDAYECGLNRLSLTREWYEHAKRLVGHIGDSNEKVDEDADE